MEYGPTRERFTLHPVSGKAVPVYKGEILRITQIEGEQCVDFNAYNLHDYKEFLAVGPTRTMFGFRPKKNSFIMTNAPRSRRMFYIAEMSETCVTDLLAARCNATLFEAALGYARHTNCQDTLAEAIGEYELTPDDVHDSYNFWFNTEWDSEGRWWINRNTGRKGDYVDLLALFDTLAVIAVCGSGDVQTTSNFSLKPIEIQVFKHSGEALDLVKRFENEYTLKNQRTPEDFRIKKIKSNRELTRNPNYVPKFVNYPLQMREVEIDLSEEEFKSIQRLKAKGLGKDDSEVVRTAFMMWYIRNKMKGTVSLEPWYLKGR